MSQSSFRTQRGATQVTSNPESFVPAVISRNESRYMGDMQREAAAVEGIRCVSPNEASTHSSASGAVRSPLRYNSSYSQGSGRESDDAFTGASAYFRQTPLTMQYGSNSNLANTNGSAPLDVAAAAMTMPSSTAQHSRHSSTNLYYCNMPPCVTDSEVQKLFAPFGEISSVAVMRNIADASSKGSGFVRFARHADAARAMAHFHLRVFNYAGISVQLQVQWAKKEHDDAIMGDVRKSLKKLFIRNVPLDVTVEDLTQHMSQYGEVEKISIHQDTTRRGAPLLVMPTDGSLSNATGLSTADSVRMIAFINFKVEGCAAQACEAIHNTSPFPSCDGIPIMAKLAEDFQRRCARRGVNATAPSSTTPLNEFSQSGSRFDSAFTSGATTPMVSLSSAPASYPWPLNGSTGGPGSALTSLPPAMDCSAFADATPASTALNSTTSTPSFRHRGGDRGFMVQRPDGPHTPQLSLSGGFDGNCARWHFQQSCRSPTALQSVTSVSFHSGPVASHPAGTPLPRSVVLRSAIAGADDGTTATRQGPATPQWHSRGTSPVPQPGAGWNWSPVSELDSSVHGPYAFPAVVGGRPAAETSSARQRPAGRRIQVHVDSRDLGGKEWRPVPFQPSMDGSSGVAAAMAAVSPLVRHASQSPSLRGTPESGLDYDTASTEAAGAVLTVGCEARCYNTVTHRFRNNPYSLSSSRQMVDDAVSPQASA